MNKKGLEFEIKKREKIYKLQKETIPIFKPNLNAKSRLTDSKLTKKVMSES
jgi:hypothetical protein